MPSCERVSVWIASAAQQSCADTGRSSAAKFCLNPVVGCCRCYVVFLKTQQPSYIDLKEQGPRYLSIEEGEVLPHLDHILYVAIELLQDLLCFIMQCLVTIEK